MPLLSWRILVGFNPSKIECFLRSQWMFIACFSCHISQTLRRSSLLTVTTTFIFLVVWIVLCLGPNLFESLVNCVVSWAFNVQVSRGGFPSDLASQPSSNSNSVKRRDLSFGCLLPFAFSGVRLSSDLLWSFPRLAQSPCLPNYWMEETAHHENDLFMEDYYAGRCKDRLRSRLFLPCHP